MISILDSNFKFLKCLKIKSLEIYQHLHNSHSCKSFISHSPDIEVARDKTQNWRINLDENKKDIPTPIEYASLPTWQYNHLKRNGINTIEQLLEMTERDFLEIRNMADKSLIKTREALLRKGFITSEDQWPKKPE